MAGLARLARRKKELEDLYAFVEDVEAPDEVLALAFEEGRGLGDASQWIRPLRDMLCRVDVAGATNRPLFVRFTAIEMLHVDTWSKAPLLTCRASWHFKCSPAKLKAWSAATGRMPPRMARLDYAESLVVHIGRVAPNPALAGNPLVDCDDSSALCAADCSDVDGDSIFDCKDSCIDVDDARHPCRAVDHDGPVDRLSRKGGTTATSQHRKIMVPAELDRGHQVRGRTRHDYADRLDLVEAGIGRIEQAIMSAETDLPLDALLQLLCDRPCWSGRFDLWQRDAGHGAGLGTPGTPGSATIGSKSNPTGVPGSGQEPGQVVVSLNVPCP